VTETPGWTHKAGPSFAQLKDRILLALEGWREHARLRRELDTLRQRGELDRTLSDNGIAPCDVRRLMRAHPRTPQQLAEMMWRLGIDRAGLPRNAAVAERLRAMGWRCGECDSWRKCRAWLASSEAPESYRAFCPNAETLEELRCSKTSPSGCSFEEPRGIFAELEATKGERVGR
jgi:uncharacterized protein YjiS (DUF1127 family)